jgi:hypothetical protein
MDAAYEKGASLSQAPNAALEPAEETADVPAMPRTARRGTRRKRGLLRRSGIVFLVERYGIVLPVSGAVAVLVAIVVLASYLMSSSGSGAVAMSAALNQLTHSQQMTMLGQEQQELAVMGAAAKVISLAGNPTKVDPDQVIQASEASQSNQGSQGSQQGAGSSSSGTNVVQAAPPDPGTAEKIGYDMLPSFGFNQTTQWTCLDELWNRESGWRYDAENPDGAYGIPQAYPGSKMASAGADWQTNPATQIKWGLTYITDTYGTPCGAWAEEEAVGSY